MNDNPKPIVFVSHISEEVDIAIALKTLIEDSFLEMMEVFVSSEAESIGMGSHWLEKITAALKACTIEMVIARRLILLSSCSSH